MNLKPINPYYKASVRARTISDDLYPYYWIEPVIDRTQEDVDHARELLKKTWEEMTVEQKEEYLTGLKGCLNRPDLERIENNIQILLDVLEIDSASFVEAVPEFPTASYFVQMRKNVAAIREKNLIYTDTPVTPELPYNTWQKFNDIEKILVDVYENINAQIYYYSSDGLYIGDTTGLIL